MWRGQNTPPMGLVSFPLRMPVCGDTDTHAHLATRRPFLTQCHSMNVAFLPYIKSIGPVCCDVTQHQSHDGVRFIK